MTTGWADETVADEEDWDSAATEYTTPSGFRSCLLWSIGIIVVIAGLVWAIVTGARALLSILHAYAGS